MPVYNEPRWVGVAVGDAARAVERSGFDDVELVVVDDGSDEETRHALAALRTPFPKAVLRQDNAGRFAARRVGIEAADKELVLLLDSRVSLFPDALRWLSARMAEHPEQTVWNAHVEIDVAGNPFARFWRTFAAAAFPDYLSDPRTTSFGPEEYDRFPKGTTAFVAPRRLLLDAIEGFSSHYEDMRNANDDTVMLRPLAARQRINISPGFGCVYRSRTSLGQFMRHAFHRGTVFFDGFARPGTRFFPVLLAVFPVSLAGVGLLLRRPRAAAALAATTPLAAAGLGARLRRPWRDTLALALLGPPFAVVYTLGIWRGAGLAARARLRRRS